MNTSNRTKIVAITMLLLIAAGLIAWAFVKHANSEPTKERYVFIECVASYATIKDGHKTYVHKDYISNIFKQAVYVPSSTVKERDNAELQLRAKIQSIIGNLPNEEWNVGEPMVNQYRTYEEASSALNASIHSAQSLQGNSLETFTYEEK